MRGRRGEGTDWTPATMPQPALKLVTHPPPPRPIGGGAAPPPAARHISHQNYKCPIPQPPNPPTGCGPHHRSLGPWGPWGGETAAVHVPKVARHPSPSNSSLPRSRGAARGCCDSRETHSRSSVVSPVSPASDGARAAAPAGPRSLPLRRDRGEGVVGRDRDIHNASVLASVCWQASLCVQRGAAGVFRGR
jgi:hypothetical protein